MQQHRVVLASGNQHKIAELQAAIAEDFPQLKVVPQTAYGVASVVEDRTTFVENALLKARHAARIAQLPTFADDSGLLVKALDGAPGLFSARFAGDQADDLANRQRLLAELVNIPNDARQAMFYCVIVFIRYADDPVPLICQGRWYGKILTEQRGINGFGYDPLFQPVGYSCSAAELSFQEKNRISHRAQALAQFLVGLQEVYGR